MLNRAGIAGIMVAGIAALSGCGPMDGDASEIQGGVRGKADSDSNVVRLAAGADPGSLADDTVLISGEGTVEGSAGIVPYTRSYIAKRTGPLRLKHGSRAPFSALIRDKEMQRIRDQSPGQALDIAVNYFSTNASGYEKLAWSAKYYVPNGDSWAGSCHSWSFSSLHPWITAHVDVEGPEGERGLWIAGQWLSRADLGNWMMALADHASKDEHKQLWLEQPTAEDVIIAAAQYLMGEGGGMIADIYNDRAHGDHQVWNQPFYAATFDVSAVSREAQIGLLRKAGEAGVSEGRSAKLIRITAQYGKEVSDDHEGAPRSSSLDWNFYVVLAEDGRLLKAFLASDPAIVDVPELDLRQSHELPDYIWKPSLATLSDVIANRPNAVVDATSSVNELRFFVGVVLAQGVPGATRSAFEQEVTQLMPEPGPIDATAADALAAKYPGVARAYKPSQWRDSLAARGLDAARFGAMWR